MLALIPLVLIFAFGLAIFAIGVHLLFSPWLLLLAVAILAWLRFGSHRARR